MSFDDPWVFIVPPVFMVSLLLLVKAGVSLIQLVSPASNIAGCF